MSKLDSILNVSGTPDDSCEGLLLVVFLKDGRDSHGRVVSGGPVIVEWRDRQGKPSGSDLPVEAEMISAWCKWDELIGDNEDGASQPGLLPDRVLADPGVLTSRERRLAALLAQAMIVVSEAPQSVVKTSLLEDSMRLLEEMESMSKPV